MFLILFKFEVTSASVTQTSVGILFFDFPWQTRKETERTFFLPFLPISSVIVAIFFCGNFAEILSLKVDNQT